MTRSVHRAPDVCVHVFVVLIVAVAASCTGAGAAARSARAVGRSSGCATRPVAAPGTTDETLTSGGVERHYQLDIPSSYKGTRPYTLVFGLHPLTINYKIVPSLSGFGDMTTKYRFIDVSPSGLLNGPAPYWNAAPVADNYDVKFLTQLLDHLEAKLCIDTSRCSRSACRTVRNCRHCSRAASRTASPALLRSPVSNSTSLVTDDPCPSLRFMAPLIRSCRTRAAG